MQKTLAGAILFCFTLAACSSPVTEPTVAPTDPLPSPTSGDARRLEFDFHRVDPVIANGESQHWTGRWMNPGGVVWHEGLFHMFINAFHSWPGEISIGHFVSSDGVVWEPAQDEPLFTSRDIGYLTSTQGADVSSAVVLPDGNWALYIHTVSRSGRAGIGMATAPAPEGPWVFSEEEILSPGQGNEWDNNQLRWPNVVEAEDGYLMFYTGANASGGLAIGVATSEDGFVWTKYDNPQTSEEVYAESDPVIVGGEGWEGSMADRPRAQYTPDGWVMIYTGAELNSRGLAFSSDGMHWEPFTGNPIIAKEDFQDWGENTWDTNLLYHDGAYYYYMEVGSLSNTQIFLATFEGSLKP